MIRKYAAITPASSYSYVAILARFHQSAGTKVVFFDIARLFPLKEWIKRESQTWPLAEVKVRNHFNSTCPIAPVAAREVAL